LKLPRPDAAVADGETQSAVTWISIAILVLSALSFTRALQRLLLGALLGVAAGIYVPIAMEWSADKYGLIGIAFALQSFLLAASFVVVIGAVVGATVVERVC
jgi:membrane protein